MARLNSGDKIGLSILWKDVQMGKEVVCRWRDLKLRNLGRF